MASLQPVKSADELRETLPQQFKARLGSASPLSIDHVLAGADESVRPALLLDLVYAEFEHRLDAGERPKLDEYLRRFPSLVGPGGQVPGRLVQLGERATSFFGAETVTDPTAPATSHAMLEEIDRIADAFEAACKADETPSIEEHLSRASESARQKLLVELVCIEYEYRVRRGEVCRIEDFAQRHASLRGDDGRVISQLRHFAAMMAAPPADAAGGPSGDEAATFPRIDGYHIVAKLGEGGMGSVYRAMQLSTKRTVALKVMKGDDSSAWRERFVREIQLTASLSHPHIARVYDSGLLHREYFYAMEFVDGQRLDRFVLDRKLSPHLIAELVAKLCRAMQHAHELGVLHRDLKPSNILVTADGTPRIVDFGLAKDTSGDSSVTLTQSGAPLGTPEYMSPEQTGGRHEHHTAATDVYGLGAILYRLLTGEPPFRGTPVAVVHKVMYEEPDRPRSLNPSLSADLEAITMKAMQKEPSQRYASTAAMADDLDRFLAGESVRARGTGFLGRLLRWTRQSQRVRLGGYWGFYVGCLVTFVHLGVIFFNLIAPMLHWEADNVGSPQIFLTMLGYIFFMDIPYLFLARRASRYELAPLILMILIDFGLFVFSSIMIIAPQAHPIKDIHPNLEVLRTIALFFFVFASATLVVHLVALNAFLSNRKLLGWQMMVDGRRQR